MICLFMDWYSSARCTCPPSCVTHHCFDSGLRLGRRIPQGLRLGNEQVEKSKAFSHACETLYPGRDFSGVIKYHKLAHHVYRVAPLAGNMRRINTELYELANREEKRVAANRTNRRGMEQQIVRRECEAMAADHARWTAPVTDDSIESLREARDARREARSEGDGSGGKHDTTAMQFPIHELLECRPPSSSSCETRCMLTQRARFN